MGYGGFRHSVSRATTFWERPAAREFKSPLAHCQLPYSDGERTQPQIDEAHRIGASNPHGPLWLVEREPGQ
jgi:hypothetical protein